MNIAIAFSPNWAEYVAVEIFALFKTNAPPVRVILMSDALDFKLPFDINKVFGPGYEIEYHNVDNMYNHLIPSNVNVDGRFTKYTLFRLLLPTLVKYDKVLYIDADAIVNGGIRELYDTDMTNFFVAGVPDTGYSVYQRKLLNIKPTDAYVNGGVMLLELGKIRALGFQNQWLSMVNRTYYCCHDQDIINKTCNGKVKIMDFKYNVSLSTSMDVPVHDVKIMHYAGPTSNKPWANKGVPFFHIWDKWEKMMKKEIRK